MLVKCAFEYPQNFGSPWPSELFLAAPKTTHWTLLDDARGCKGLSQNSDLWTLFALFLVFQYLMFVTTKYAWVKLAQNHGHHSWFEDTESYSNNHQLLTEPGFSATILVHSNIFTYIPQCRFCQRLWGFFTMKYWVKLSPSGAWHRKRMRHSSLMIVYGRKYSLIIGSLIS